MFSLWLGLIELQIIFFLKSASAVMLNNHFQNFHYHCKYFYFKNLIQHSKIILFIYNFVNSISLFCLCIRPLYRVKLDRHLLLADLLSFQNGITQIQKKIKGYFSNTCKFSLRNMKSYVIYVRKIQAFFLHTLYLERLVDLHNSLQKIFALVGSEIEIPVRNQLIIFFSLKNNHLYFKLST